MRWTMLPLHSARCAAGTPQVCGRRAECRYDIFAARAGALPGLCCMLGVSAGVPRMEHQAHGEDRHLLQAFLSVVARAIGP